MISALSTKAVSRKMLTYGEVTGILAPTYSLDEVASRHDENILPVFKFIQLGKECIHNLARFSAWRRQRKSIIHTRRPSEGSVPAMAPALAAVNDSTSSGQGMNFSVSSRMDPLTN